MKNYGDTRSNIRPQATRTDDKYVWVASNIREITVEDEEGNHTEYEYNLVRYDKDEYIMDRMQEYQDALIELAEVVLEG